MFNFKQYIDEFESKKSDIVKELGETAIEFFLGEFDAQQWTDENGVTTQWPDLSESTIKSRQFPNERILVQTKDLRNALEDSIISSDWNNGIEFEVDSEYASYHNDGGDEPGKPPKRQFIGESYELDKMLEEKLEEELKKIFK